MSTWTKIKGYVPLAAIVVAFAWSGLSILFYRAKGPPPGAVVIRFGHWQLEASVREGLDEMARRYRELHPNVWIVQDAIPDGVYGQWASTQLMGGTAPDIMQVGAILPDNIWWGYYTRYFLSLGRQVNAVNPYNRDTDLQERPLRLTYKDGMKTAYVDVLQDYYSVPLSLFGTRIFYNKDLLKKLTGLDAAPRDYRGFLDACRTIARQTSPNGQLYTPVAGSGYHLPWWDSMMFDALTYPAVAKADFNRDGFVGGDELYVAITRGRLGFDFPAYAAKFRMMREVTDFFQTGYTGLGRDEAVFLFAQQKAVFMSTGSWDARSLQEQARGVFEVGLMDYPLPRPDDPDYGPYIHGPIYESVGAGFRFGVTRFSKHPEVALDFLLFLASQEQNEELNKIIGWIPAVIGTEIDPLLAAFEPHLEGVYGALPATLGGETTIRWGQLVDAFKVGSIDFPTLAREYDTFYREKGKADFLEAQRVWRRGMHQAEQFLAGIRSRALGAPDEATRQSEWVRYRALTAQRQVWAEVDHSRQMRLIEQGVDPNGVGPYEYSPQVLERVRARVNAAP